MRTDPNSALAGLIPRTVARRPYRPGTPRDLRLLIGERVERGIAGLDCPRWDTSGFYVAEGSGRADNRIQLGNNVRTFPSTLPDVRTHDLHLLDLGLYKTITLPRGASLQVRAEAINALNYTVLWAPNQIPANANFGVVNLDRNNPFDLQLGVRLTFCPRGRLASVGAVACLGSRVVEQVQGSRSQRLAPVTRAQAARDLNVESEDHLFANAEGVAGRGQAFAALRRVDGEVYGLRRFADRVVERRTGVIVDRDLGRDAADRSELADEPVNGPPRSVHE